MIVAYVCVYSSTRSSKRSSIEKETRKPFALASTKAFFVLRTKKQISSFLSLHFYPRKSSIPSDIIAQKCFPSLPLLSSFLRPARTRYEILFPSFSLCFPFFAFFASKRFALRRFVLFLSLARIDFSQAGESQVAKVWIVIARSFTRPLYLSFFARVSSRQRQRRISPFLVYSLFSTK